MATETSAQRGEWPPTRVAEDDYQSFCAALGASERGSAFLQEYARRNRHADTEVVLEALFRLERVAHAQKPVPEAERIRQDLRALLDTIRSARPQIDSTPGAIKAATLSALIEFVQARIEALVQPLTAPLAAVPELEQPELPIPQPGPTVQRTIALVPAIASPPEPLSGQYEPQDFALKVDPRVPAAARNFDPDFPVPELPRPTKIIPEVNFIDSLFDAIDGKAKDKTDKKSEAIVPSPPAVTAAAPVVTLATPASAVAATPDAFLPTIDLTPVAAPSGEATAVVIEETATVSETLALSETTDDTETVGMAESITRATNATVAAIDASAAAIDEIVAAAEAAIAEEAARAEASLGEPAFVETAFGETSVAEVATSESPAAHTETIVTAAAIEPAVNAVAAPAPHVVDNALAEIMALSEEERLALFT